MNPLRASLEQSAASAAELIELLRPPLHVPLGVNVESVSIRREEIEASVELAERLAAQVRVTRPAAR